MARPVIAGYLPTPLSRKDQPVSDAPRLSAGQFLTLDRSPVLSPKESP
jgi:hypothetical protein